MDFFRIKGKGCIYAAFTFYKKELVVVALTCKAFGRWIEHPCSKKHVTSLLLTGKDQTVAKEIRDMEIS